MDIDEDNYSWQHIKIFTVSYVLLEILFGVWHCCIMYEMCKFPIYIHIHTNIQYYYKGMAKLNIWDATSDLDGTSKSIITFHIHKDNLKL